MKFADFFRDLWGYDPFPWQEMLAERVVGGEWPSALDLPTAAGKTACIDVAVFALATQADRSLEGRTAPRRIWFVVDRRIVVDEAHERAEKIAKRLREAKSGVLKEVADRLLQLSGLQESARPLATAKLRGGILKDDGWARIPSQPAVITSTVDQLGSNLLFRTYSHSQLAAPIYAGLAANDSLILLDEAHCSVPFSQTVSAIREFRGERWMEERIPAPFSFAVLSATLGETDGDVFPAEDERDAALDHPVLEERINASKPAELTGPLKSKKADKVDDPLIAEASRLALAWAKEGKRRIALIVNRVVTAETLAHHLQTECKEIDTEADVVLLTGRLRPLDRDQLVNKWTAVLAASNLDKPESPIFFVSTQCIEVGADFSFDGLITECASLDALRQRFGRLNRMGKFKETEAAILTRHDDALASANPDPVYGTAMRQTWEFLNEHAEVNGTGRNETKTIDFGIAAMEHLLEDASVDLEPLLAPKAEAPMLLPAHLDLLCQTSPTPHPEPDISLFLHGKERGAPEVRVLWRADLAEDCEDDWAEIVALCPPNSLEMLSVPLYRLRNWLGKSASVDDGSDVEGVDASPDRKGSCRPVLCWRGRDKSGLAKKLGQIRPGDTIVIPARYGMDGLAQRRVDADEKQPDDIWELTLEDAGKRPALRLHPSLTKDWPESEPFRELMELANAENWEHREVHEQIAKLSGMEGDSAPSFPEHVISVLKDVQRIESHPDRGLILFGKKPVKSNASENDLFADDDDLTSRTDVENGVSLTKHTQHVLRAAEQIAAKCLPGHFLDAMRITAKWHDIGKLDQRFQNYLRNGDEPAAAGEPPQAKFGGIALPPARRKFIREAVGLPDGFRHEMLSVQLAEQADALPEEERETILHLIGSHHGHGRPFAPVVIDDAPPGVGGEVLESVEAEITGEARAETPPHRLDSGISDRFWTLNRRFGWWGLAYLEAIFRLADWYASANEDH
ncbi:MAG: type I-U CRISPR-associated helicase/endonuclease Cas3 [Akkermansiaceae bacterium]|nr:type I-U CRISPR-associated helicase/endonuclease Cas3 [Akkermansiaceae bacterium]